MLHWRRESALVLVGLALLGGWIASCSGRADAAALGHTRLVITGSSTLAPLVGAIAERYEQAHAGVRIDVQTGGSGRGVADVRAGRAQLGMISRDLYEEEAELSATPIAQDGVCVIVHADSELDGLTREQARALWTGAVHSWSELGGDDSAPTVVNKAAGRATRSVFAAYLGLEEHELVGDLVIGDNEQGIKTVAGDPQAVGYVSIGAAQRAVDEGVSVRLLAADGVRPSLSNLAQERFPVRRALHLVSVGERSPLAVEFVAYARSSAVHDLVEGLGLVPVGD